MKGRVLVVDDDLSLAEMLGIVLRSEGLEPSFCSDGDKAIDAFRDSKPDVVLLDVMLPGKNGIEICRQIRAESGVPIIMLTARDEEIDRVFGLEIGADDYVTKPFGLRELIARIRAVTRRRAVVDAPVAEVLELGNLKMDLSTRRVYMSGNEIELTTKEFDLLWSKSLFVIFNFRIIRTLYSKYFSNLFLWESFFLSNFL